MNEREEIEKKIQEIKAILNKEVLLALDINQLNEIDILLEKIESIVKK